VYDVRNCVRFNYVEIKYFPVLHPSGFRFAPRDDCGAQPKLQGSAWATFVAWTQDGCPWRLFGGDRMGAFFLPKRGQKKHIARTGNTACEMWKLVEVEAE